MTHFTSPQPPTTTEPDALGAPAIEIATMLGDSVVDVKHCMNPRGGKVTMKTWGLFAAGGACLLSSAIAFAVSVDVAASNKAALGYHTNVLQKPEYAFRPASTPAGLPVVAFGGLALGLLGLTAGLGRLRRERRSPYYRVGTAPGVEQPLESAPAASFPLVAPSGEAFVFNYGPGIDGEMFVDGQTTPLAELVASGRARPSLATAGAIEVPLPLGARIRARSGNTTFMVSAVAPPREDAMPLIARLDHRALAYVAGSLAVHVAVWGMLQFVPVDHEGADLQFASLEETTVRSSTTDTDTLPPEQEPDDGLSGGSEGAGARMALAEGASGTPKSDRADGHIRIKNTDRPPAMSRAEAIEQARTAGIMGSTTSLTQAIGTLASDQDYASGFDDVSVYGPMFGGEGEGKGVFGGGYRGFGKGGGCSLPPCGIIGTGRYGTIGTGDRAGDGWGRPGDGKGPLRRRTAIIPTDFIGVPTASDGIDKSIIRRYIKRNINKIAYCYEKQLLAHPGLAGTVSVQFLIAPNGSVQSSHGAGVNNEVASCVAGVVKSINFPAPKTGGNVQVNYPFNFHAAGQ